MYRTETYSLELILNLLNLKLIFLNLENAWKTHAKIAVVGKHSVNQSDSGVSAFFNFLKPIRRSKSGHASVRHEILGGLFVIVDFAIIRYGRRLEFGPILLLHFLGLAPTSRLLRLLRNAYALLVCRLCLEGSTYT
jgi:hypothetical protein